MNELEILYKALKEYNRITSDRRDLSSLRAAIGSDKSNEQLKSVFYICEIEDDWINEIEKGLAEVGAAIAEERQFIRSDGEVVPIEKSRHFSKDAVVHLAKHSNLLTHEPDEEGDIIPDKIYTVEKLSDYTVYENKFLYMLLTFLKDFVSYRYNKIIDLSFTYKSFYNTEKQIVYRDRTISYNIGFEEKRKDDPYLKQRNSLSEKIERIKSILTEIEFYLSTPLMTEVAKANVIKPPVTRTNVLLMDKHFKEVMKLYDFIYAYTGKGYSVKEKAVVVSPLREEVSAELAELAVLTSFYTYKFNFQLDSELEEACKKDEIRLRKEEEQRELARIKRLRKQIEESGVGAEEYMVALEKRNRNLEAQAVQFDGERKIFEKTQQDLKQSELENREKEKRIAECEKNIALQKAQYETEINQLRDESEKQLREAQEEFERKLSESEQNHRAQIEELSAAAALREEELVSAAAAREQELTLAAAKREEELNSEIVSAKEENNAVRAELEYTVAERDKTKNDLAVSQSKNVALRVKFGMASDEDYTTEEGFNELEQQYGVFSAFFEEEWRKTQKEIRKSVLNFSNVKKIAKERAQKKKKKDDNN